MMKFKQFLVKYDYSSVQINIKNPLAHKIVIWGEYYITDSDLFINENDFAREDSPHITVLYGIHTNKLTNIKFQEFEIELDKISFFENEKYNVAKIDVKGKYLHTLHNKLKTELEVTESYPTYKPHITIAYIQKGKCKDLIGNTDFKGIKIKVNELVFSAKNDEKLIIPAK